MKHLLCLCLVLISTLCGACAYRSESTMTSPAPDLDTRYQRISDHIRELGYGEGPQQVLKVAHTALKDKHARGEGHLVSLEDLWSHALQEGRGLMDQPERRWGRTSAEETADMVGQTTVGPWQITIRNIRTTYGPPYGVKPSWPPAQINAFCREHPEIQARMIIDYIQRSYATFGKRSPYAIQRYFWLEPFVRGGIGQSPDWTRIVVAKPPPGGTWKDLTPEMKADTGFYAKQVLMGTPYTDSGLLYWFYVSGDLEGVRDTLRTWRDQKRIRVSDDPDHSTHSLEGTSYILTEEPGSFGISPSDVLYYKSQPEIHRAIRELIQEIAEETHP